MCGVSARKAPGGSPVEFPRVRKLADAQEGGGCQTEGCVRSCPWRGRWSRGASRLSIMSRVMGSRSQDGLTCNVKALMPRTMRYKRV